MAALSCRMHRWSKAIAAIRAQVSQAYLPIEDGSTPAYWAARHGNLPMLEFLLQIADSHPEFREAIFETRRHMALPFHAAAVNDHIDCMEFLMRHAPLGISALEKPTEDGGAFQPVHHAAIRGCIPSLEFLVKHAPSGNAILEAKDSQGRPVIFFAIHRGSVKVIQYLLDNAPSGAEILEAKDDNGTTCAHFAIRHQSFYVLDFILEHAPSSIDLLDDTHEELSSVKKSYSPGKLERIAAKNELHRLRRAKNIAGPLVDLILTIIIEETELKK